MSKPDPRKLLVNLKHRKGKPAARSKGRGTSAAASTKGSKGKKDYLLLRFLRRCYNSVVLSVTLLLLLVFVVSAYSDWVEPSIRTAIFPVLGVCFPFILLFVVLWMVYLLILWHWKCLLLCVFACAMCYSSITRTFPMHFRIGAEPTVEATPGGETVPFRILTFNTCLMGQQRLQDKRKKLGVMEMVRQSGADVVCLQEYRFLLTEGYTEPEIRKLLSDLYPYYDCLHYSLKNGKQSKRQGIALFSKYPIKKAKRIDSSSRYFASMYYELDVKGCRIAIINNHLHTNAIDVSDREYVDELVENKEHIDGERIRKGLIRNLCKGSIARSSESAIVAKKREAVQDEMPLIICGDMNDTPISYCYHNVRGPLSDLWEEVGFGVGATYYHHKFYFRIDHIFHNHFFKAVDISVFNHFNMSDHYPIMGTFELSKKLSK